jgi:hypothetical protein
LEQTIKTNCAISSGDANRFWGRKHTGDHDDFKQTPLDSTHERNPVRRTSQCPNPKRTSVGMNLGSSSSSRRGILASWFAVPTRPGLIQLTRMPCAERSNAMARVMPSNAAFAEQYALMFGMACCARTLPIFTMTPADCRGWKKISSERNGYAGESVRAWSSHKKSVR